MYIVTLSLSAFPVSVKTGVQHTLAEPAAVCHAAVRHFSSLYVV